MQLDHIQLVTREISDVHSFFSALPSMQVTSISQGYFEVQTNGTGLAIYDTDAFESATGMRDVSSLGGTVLQFSVRNVDDSLNAAKRALGVELAVGPIQTNWGTRSGYVKHKSGVVIEFYSWN